jgi:hypothetical protein
MSSSRTALHRLQVAIVDRICVLQPQIHTVVERLNADGFRDWRRTFF